MGLIALMLLLASLSFALDGEPRVRWITSLGVVTEGDLNDENEDEKVDDVDGRGEFVNVVETVEWLMWVEEDGPGERFACEPVE